MVGPHAAKTVWEHLEYIFIEHVSGPDLTVADYESWFHLAADVTRTLKHEHPEYIAPICCLGLPRANRLWGQCALCPDGVSHKLMLKGQVSDANLKSLVQDMRDSDALKGSSADFEDVGMHSKRIKGRGKKRQGRDGDTKGQEQEPRFQQCFRHGM